jgi:hypothetical protein
MLVLTPNMSAKRTKENPMPETAIQYDHTLYRDVWSAMNACNGRALLNTWNNKWAEQIKKELALTGNSGTDAFNEHPINLVVADKLLQLGGVYVTNDKLQAAYDTTLSRCTEV